MSTEATIVTPTRGGQVVRSTQSGTIGITTGPPAKRSSTIGVQFVGGDYDVVCQVEDLEVMDPAVLSHAWND